MTDRPTPSIAICIPATDTCATDFARDLSSMVGYTAIAHPEIRLRNFVCKGTIIPEVRHKLVRAALQHEDVTHILWLDSDMRFPKDALLRMLAHNVEVVAANYATRRQPVIPTASTGEDDALLFSLPGQTELVEVARCGMGVMLVELELYRRIQAPWFAVGFNRAQDGYAGEDVFFCDLVQRAGLKVRVDPALSEQVEHCGAFAYTMDHARLTRLEMLAESGAPDGPVTAQEILRGP